MIVAVDIALRKSGYVVTDDKGKVIHKGMVLVPPKEKYTTYIQTLYLGFLEVFRDIQGKFPDAELELVVEDVADFFHKTSALGIHAARTACVLAWVNLHISKNEVSYYTPSKVKYFLTNKRGADKDLLKSSLQEKYPHIELEGLEEDEIDALALALLHIHNRTGENSEPIVQKTKRKRAPRRSGV